MFFMFSSFKKKMKTFLALTEVIRKKFNFSAFIGFLTDPQNQTMLVKLIHLGFEFCFTVSLTATFQPSWTQSKTFSFCWKFRLKSFWFLFLAWELFYSALSKAFYLQWFFPLTKSKHPRSCRLAPFHHGPNQENLVLKNFYTEIQSVPFLVVGCGVPRNHKSWFFYWITSISKIFFEPFLEISFRSSKFQPKTFVLYSRFRPKNLWVCSLH